MPGQDTPSAEVVVCVDFGSTFTKVLAVCVPNGEVVAAASHRTTIDSDVMDGFDACLAEMSSREPRVRGARVLACSSAGGGLRIAVVGNEALVSAEAGRRVALSSGGSVVAVIAGGLANGDNDATLDAADADVVLLVGGTDGGNSETLVADAGHLAARGWRRPVVVAGNVAAQPEVTRVLADAAVPHVLAPNVVPRIGVLAPEGARAAIREMFLRHVIGGKELSTRADFAAMVSGPTPDVVLTAVELLARGSDAAGTPGIGDVVVVDIGGATTDVHSVCELDPEDAGLGREVVATTEVTRTVEGDLGMRWSAVSTVRAGDRVDLARAASVRGDDPSFLPSNAAEQAEDLEIGAIAAQTALRRHAGRNRVVLGEGGRVVERGGRDLREVRLVVGSGGVLRAARGGAVAAAVDRILAPLVGVDPDGWQVPRAARIVVDSEYVLAAAGLLAEEYPHAAMSLLTGLADHARPAQPGSVGTDR